MVTAIRHSREKNNPMDTVKCTGRGELFGNSWLLLHLNSSFFKAFWSWASHRYIFLSPLVGSYRYPWRLRRITSGLRPDYPSDYFFPRMPDPRPLKKPSRGIITINGIGAPRWEPSFIKESPTITTTGTTFWITLRSKMYCISAKNAYFLANPNLKNVQHRPDQEPSSGANIFYFYAS